MSAAGSATTRPSSPSASGQPAASWRFEVDEALAVEARRNVAPFPSIEVRHGHGSAVIDEAFDAILVNAGVTHPLDVWLDALAPGGRMILPLTDLLLLN
jgi:protein-L-isoaspartate O-methyltransferase